MSEAADSAARQDNEDVLRDMARQGIDLRVERNVEFAHLAPDQASAEAFAAAARAMGYRVSISSPDEESIEEGETDWDVICTQTFVPSVDALTEHELALAKRARDFGCTSDGWGFES